MKTVSNSRPLAEWSVISFTLGTLVGCSRASQFNKPGKVSDKSGKVAGEFQGTRLEVGGFGFEVSGFEA